MCHNDESMYPDDFEDDALFPDSEDEYIAGQGENDGPPNVSDEKLQELEEKAALDEVEKLHQMDVIEPVTLSDNDAANENVVDTTLVYDWRFRNQQWIRRCRIVAREFKTGATDEKQLFSHVLICVGADAAHLCHHLQLGSHSIGCQRRFSHGTSGRGDVCENSNVDQEVDRKATHSLAFETMSSRSEECGTSLASAYWWFM